MEMEEAKLEMLRPDVMPRPNGPSQARLKYSKSPASPALRTRQPANPPKNRSWRERLIFQATICGGFLAVLLLFNIVDTAFTNQITDWTSRNLSYNILNEEGGVASWMDGVLSIFRNDDGTTYGASPIPTSHPGAGGLDDSWIDEGVLDEILN